LDITFIVISRERNLYPEKQKIFYLVS